MKVYNKLETKKEKKAHKKEHKICKKLRTSKVQNEFLLSMGRLSWNLLHPSQRKKESVGVS